jgi:hypothetical protein
LCGAIAHQCRKPDISGFWPTSVQAGAPLFRSLTTLCQLIENPDDLIDSIPLLAKSRQSGGFTL